MTIPITVLTGFLGAGKTTLLNRALRSPLLGRALVIVNELGAVPLDHLLVAEVAEDVLLLQSGCVCCSVRGDLVETLLAEGCRAGEPRFDRVVLETTGLADPTPIVATILNQARLASRFHLDAVITVVDAALGAATLARHREAEKQVLLADDVILNKLDCASAAQVDAVKATIAELNSHARLFPAERGETNWDALLRWTPSTVAARLDGSGGYSSHPGSAVRSFSVQVERAVAYRHFALWLSMVTQLHGEHLLRVKGLLRVDDQPGPVVVQAVQHVVYPPCSMPTWPSEDRSSRLAVITRGMDEALFAELRTSLEDLLNG